MTDPITPNNVVVKKKDTKKIFLGFVMILLGVFSLGLAKYWPDLQNQFFPGQIVQAEKETPDTAPAPKTLYDPMEIGRKEGYLWIDHSSADPSGQYVVTLGSIHGVTSGRKLNIYEGTDLLGQVVVDRSTETISYVHPDASVNIAQNDYYRVVIE